MLRLRKSTVAAILREAAGSPDKEVCGLVWASGDWPGDGRIEHVHPLPNVHPEPDKYYRTAPKDVREAFESMDEDGGEPVAWYHSHPGGKSDPSEEDMRGAFNTGMYYLIAYPESFDLMADDQVISTKKVWRLSVWECLSVGVLLEAEWVEES